MRRKLMIKPDKRAAGISLRLFCLPAASRAIQKKIPTLNRIAPSQTLVHEILLVYPGCYYYFSCLFCYRQVDIG